jgi:dTDP-4-dehydrorhamnose reductase
MDRLLITGVSGFAGWHLARHLKGQYRIYGTYLDHPVDLEAVETLAFDLTNLSKIERLCSTIKPKVIVHTAALSNPDYCETHHQEALTLNTFATRELARAASHLGIRIIYFSTDLLFSGETGMYSEADAPAPLSYYAKTKHLGELEIMNNCSYYSTLRFSLLYGRGNGLNKNLVETMEQQALQNSKMNLFTNQFRTPLYVEDAVMALERFVADRSLKGLFHLGGPNRLSRFQFGELFCRIFNFPQRLLAPCLLEEAKLAAPRPRDCSLNSEKARNCLQMEFRSVEEGLRDVFKARQAIQSCS